MNTTKGTEESDVITTLAIGISAMVTIIMIALGVLLLVPLEPIMTSEVVKTASTYVIPALFGALIIGLLKSRGEVQVKGKLLAGIVPFVLILAVNIFIFNTTQYSGVLLIVMIPITILSAYVLFRKGKITIVLENELEVTE